MSNVEVNYSICTQECEIKQKKKTNCFYVISLIHGLFYVFFFCNLVMIVLFLLYHRLHIINL